MVPASNLLAFIAASFVIIVIPGPGVPFMVGRALALGGGASVRGVGPGPRQRLPRVRLELRVRVARGGCPGRVVVRVFAARSGAGRWCLGGEGRGPRGAAGAKREGERQRVPSTEGELRG